MPNFTLYTPIVLGHALHRVLEDYKKRGQPVRPPTPISKRVEWIKQTCDKVINLMIAEMTYYNKSNAPERVSTNDVFSVLFSILERLYTVTGKPKPPKS